MSQYPEVLERIKNGDQYLDIGCCVGQDIRKLVSDLAIGGGEMLKLRKGL